MENKIKLPIRQLVEFILRSGDIDSRYVEKDRMYEGARAHRSIQKNNMKFYDDYKSEITLSTEFRSGDIVYTLEGRADGIFRDEGKVVMDEIKTTVLPMHLIEEDFNSTHWAQAQCYAYIYASQNDLTEISVQLTYFNLDTEEIKHFRKSFEFQGLEQFLTELIQKYSVWASFTAEWQKLRDQTIQELEFPFSAYRKGQRKLAVGTYRIIDRGGKLYAQAPTGTGKTISTLFPAVKAMGEGKSSKIFYLTAKTITRQVAEEAFEKMRAGNLRMKTLTLTAKEKICFKDETNCNPEYCEYARGYFDKVNDVVSKIFDQEDILTREIVEAYARRNEVCPFELSLDLSYWMDCIICDYNYVFDPRASLKRFFLEKENDYVLLIDEAHNLVDRAREMFSAELHKKAFLELKRLMKTSAARRACRLKRGCSKDATTSSWQKIQARAVTISS
jgi:hypothetical protein